MSRLALAALLLCACGGPSRTEILVEVRSDLLVPDELDAIEIAARSPEGVTQTSSARLGPGEIPLPRVLGMVHTSGPLGPYDLEVRGRRGSSTVVSRRAAVTFQLGRTLVLVIELLRECATITCGTGETCARGGCRAEEVQANELLAWDGVVPPSDAAVFDTCLRGERCNGVDDDCDGTVDEGIDLQTDPDNCGGCGIRCARPNTVTSCTAGRCAVVSCEGTFLDCDRDPSNGCEVDSSTSVAHCGACRTACGPPDRECCAGMCMSRC